MDSVTNLEARFRAVEDRLEIQALAARFSDAVNERDVTAFAQLWASDRPIWGNRAAATVPRRGHRRNHRDVPASPSDRTLLHADDAFRRSDDRR